MTIKNTPSSYGSVAKAFHWGSAALYVGIFCVAYYMMAMPASDLKWTYYGLHKSFGVLTLLIVAFRLLWRWTTVTPAQEPGVQSWMQALAWLAHYGLYILMFAMPISGYLMSTAGGHDVALFGLTLPQLIGQDKALAKVMREAHTYISYGLIALVALHILAALWHHMIRKDNTLRRMLPS